MASINEMAQKGYEKLSRKQQSMARNWSAAQDKMIAGYRNVGFGPNVTQRYTDGVQAAEYRAPDADKWRTNWMRAMSD